MWDCKDNLSRLGEYKLDQAKPFWVDKLHFPMMLILFNDHLRKVALADSKLHGWMMYGALLSIQSPFLLIPNSKNRNVHRPPFSNLAFDKRRPPNAPTSPPPLLPYLALERVQIWRLLGNVVLLMHQPHHTTLPYLALEWVRAQVGDDDEAAVVAHVHVVRIGHLRGIIYLLDNSKKSRLETIEID